MNMTHWRRAPLAALCAALIALTLAPAGATGGAAAAISGGAPIVTIEDGAVRGTAVPGGYAFLGLPYAAPPTGDLRWRAPQPPAAWEGVRDATQFAPSCPQTRRARSCRPGPISEDCLYLNVYMPTRDSGRAREGDDDGAAGAGVDPRRRPHAGRQPQLRRHQARGRRHRRRHDQLPARRARLPGAPGARRAAGRPGRQLRPDGPAGRAALGPAQHRAVRRRPAQRDHRRPVGRRRVGAGPARLARRARAVPAGDRAERRVRADPAAAGRRRGRRRGVRAPRRAARTRPRRACVTCRSQHLVSLPASRSPASSTARSSPSRSGRRWPRGRFARVPILNGINHDEELYLRRRPRPGRQPAGRSCRCRRAGDRRELPDRHRRGAGRVGRAGGGDRGRVPAQRLPVAGRGLQHAGRRTRTSRARRCRWTAGPSQRVPTFAYEFNDDNAPPRFARPDACPWRRTASEIQYLFDQPNTPLPGRSTADQQALAASMRTAWASFAATGNPSTQRCPGRRSATVRTCCRSCRRSHRSRPTSPPPPLRVLGRRVRVPRRLAALPATARQWLRATAWRRATSS